MDIVRPSLWRFFPWVVVGLLGGVAGVNGVMVWRAIATHPGVATQAMFDTSNRYDAILADEARQRALGWSLQMAAADGHLAVDLRGADGQPLEGARVAGVAARPAGGATDVALAFRAAAPGHYVSETGLPAGGQWDVVVSASAAGRSVRATQRVIVP
jgi:nitrogen fixation protein FixH